MAICLFTDFGAGDLYVGQVEAVLERDAPGVRVINLLNEAPPFDVRASAHLLAALVTRVPDGQVVIGIVDPGVGTDRGAVALHADANWYVGPDNGLLSVAAARARRSEVWRLPPAPSGASPSFHGRDVFAPVAAAIATERFAGAGAVRTDDLEVRLDAADLPEVIYIDHYGNAWTGLRAGAVAPPAQRLEAAGHVLLHARVFGESPPGAAFWYENSSGLVEIAVNRGSAARTLGLEVGTPVALR
jgi:S-adenosylmethionine hydrolase